MMQNQKVFFNPPANTVYKIISVIDANKAFTLQQGTQKLILQDFKSYPNQLFHIYNSNSKFAFVNPKSNIALHVQNQNADNGGAIKGDSGQFTSSYFEMESVSQGQWSNKAFFLKSFAGKALDIKGGKPNPNTQICQWGFHGGPNQQWVVVAIDITFAFKHQGIIEVPSFFSPSQNTLYTVATALDPSKVFTVDYATSKLSIKTYNGDASQKFTIFTDQNKFAFVVASTQTGLSIPQDSKENTAQPVTDPGKHASSWFEIVQTASSQWSNKGYFIKTYTGTKGLDVYGNKAGQGTPVIQWDLHGGDNQLWLIQPVVEQWQENSKGHGHGHKHHHHQGYNQQQQGGWGQKW